MKVSPALSIDLFIHAVSVAARAAVVGVSAVRQLSLGSELDTSEVERLADALGLQAEVLRIPRRDG